MVVPTDLLAAPEALLPPPPVLRLRLASAMRDVDILSGLLKLSERVARRDGRNSTTNTTRPPAQTAGQEAANVR